MFIMKKIIPLSIAALLSLSVGGYAVALDEETPQAEQAQYQQHATKHNANNQAKKVNKESQHQTKNNATKRAKQHKKEAKTSSTKTTEKHNSSVKQPKKVEESYVNTQAE